MGHHLADPHPALLDEGHDPPHLAGGRARADELELVEDEPLHRDLDPDGRDPDGGAATAAAEHAEGPLDGHGHAGALEDDVGAEAAGHLADDGDRVAGRRVDGLEAERGGLGEPIAAARRR